MFKCCTCLGHVANFQLQGTWVPVVAAIGHAVPFELVDGTLVVMEEGDVNGIEDVGKGGGEGLGSAVDDLDDESNDGPDVGGMFLDLLMCR